MLQFETRITNELHPQRLRDKRATLVTKCATTSQKPVLHFLSSFMIPLFRFAPGHRQTGGP